MAARRSSCGQAPPRPGCLLKTQEKAHEARHGEPPMCPEPRSAHNRPAAQWLFTYPLIHSFQTQSGGFKECLFTVLPLY